jgi:hypothetical protein
MANPIWTTSRRGPSPILRGAGGGLSPVVRGALVFGLAAALVAAAGGASAGPARLILSGAVTFPDSDPDAVPVIGPQSVTLGVEVLGPVGVPWTLTFIANSDLQSGSNVIPISNVSWTVTPNPPFRNGALSTVTPIVLATGFSHSRLLATFRFFMPNSWNYVPGNYTATATLTLAAP